MPERPVSIGDGSWLGHGTVVLPGARIGRHVVVGAGSVVTGDLPDHCVAVGAPARVVRRYVEGEGWKPVRLIWPGPDVAASAEVGGARRSSMRFAFARSSMRSEIGPPLAIDSANCSSCPPCQLST